VFELMEQSPARPDFFAIYPDVAAIPYLAQTDLFAQELFMVTIPDDAIASAGPVQGVWRADWSLAGSGSRFHQADIVARTTGLTVVDVLDVADLEDETVHGVVWWNTTRGMGFPTELRQMRYRAPPAQEALDGGRLLTGGIALDVPTSPGEPLWIIARLHAEERGSVTVEVEGRVLGQWSYPALPGWWLETAYQIPGDSVSSARSRITLRVDAGGPDPHRYAPYHYWFLQGESAEAEPSIDYPMDVVFEPGLHMLGLSLPRLEWKPGEGIAVTLYWWADGVTDIDAKTFFHLLDEESRLVAQADGWACFDTRPPFTWQPGEIITDKRTLQLPGDVKPGTLYLGVGMYTPDGSSRLAAFRDGSRQLDDRVPLMSLEIVE
jgi:hypothetical protein